jgi:type I restriction enzyme S subunit
VRKGWEVNKLGQTCDFIRGPFGGSLKKSIFVDKGYAVYEQSHAIYNQFDNIRYHINENKFKEMLRFELKPGNIIMSCSGTMGKIAIVPEGIKKGIINQALLILKPNENIYNTFLKYLLESNVFQEKLKSYSKGVAIKNVASVKILKDIAIEFPSVKEQKQIVSILDEAFEGIAKAKANVEKNLANAKEIFESYLQAVFLDSNTERKMIGDVCKIIGGGTPSKSKPHYYNGNIPWASVRDMKSELLEKTEFCITEEAVKNSSTNIISRGNIIIATRVGLGKVCLLKNDTAINQDLKGIIPINNIIRVKYLFYWFKFVAKEIISHGVGATVQGVKLDFVNRLLIPVPNILQQDHLINKLDCLTEETNQLLKNYEQKLVSLEELKKSILQKAFSGDLIRRAS